MLKQKGYSMNTSSEHYLVKQLKESYCYIPLDYQIESKKDLSLISQNFELPDGQIMQLDIERFNNPSLFGKDIKPIQQQIADQFPLFHDKNIQSSMFNNLIFTGSPTLTQGFQERIENELLLSLPSNTRYRTLFFPERSHSAWTGGSIFASLSF